MFIKRSEVFGFISKIASLTAENAALRAQAAANEVSVGWMRLRVNQLEHERAVLVQTYIGVKMSVPEIEQKPATPADISKMLQDSGLNFNDVGDEEARRLGLDWDPNTGEVIQLQPATGANL